jgi:hypothetical protein
MKQTSYSIKKGTKNECFFLIPSIIMTQYSPNTWSDKTKYITIGFLKYVIEIAIITKHKNIDYTVDQVIVDRANFILHKYNFYISDTEELTKYLKNNQKIVLLLKNCNPNNQYFQKTFINIIKYNNFIKER